MGIKSTHVMTQKIPNLPQGRKTVGWKGCRGQVWGRGFGERNV